MAKSVKNRKRVAPKRRHSMHRRRTPHCPLGKGKDHKRAIVQTFMEMLNAVKLYHWNTHSFSQHKATDELHSRLSENVDKFMEVLLGKDASRLKHLDKKIALINARNTTEFKSRIHEYRECFIDMNNCFDSHRDSDLLNIRDEILADLNQFLYLLTLK
jgi:DNA-binding ferritin-like protein